MAAKTTEPVLVDTNILIEAIDTKRIHHADALRLLERHPQLFMPAQVVREYLVACTRSRVKNGLGLPLAVALQSVNAFRRNIRLLPEEKPILPRFLELLADASYCGNHIHDVHLVATALAHKVPILLTLNTADFSAFKARLSIVTPAEL